MGRKERGSERIFSLRGRERDLLHWSGGGVVDLICCSKNEGEGITRKKVKNVRKGKKLIFYQSGYKI